MTYLDHSRARIPDPTEELWEGMAKIAYAEFVESGIALMSAKEFGLRPPPWYKLSANLRTAWRRSMRAAWVHVAISGGAKQSAIPRRNKPAL